MSQLQLQFLGTFRLARADKSIPYLRSVRIQALLAYLALEAQQPHPRATLAARFWPDEPEPAAKQNLRQALYQLRHLLGEAEEATPAAPPYLLVTRETVQFNPASDHDLDVTRFLAHLAQQQWRAANDLYQGELLSGLTSGSELFEEWLLVQREHFHLLALEALDHLIEQALAQSDYAQIQSYARRQLLLEPWRETAHRHLIYALAASGDRSLALAHYETCRQLLAEELGVEPDGATVALVEQIRKGDIDKVTRWQGDKVRGWQGDKVTIDHPLTLPPPHLVTPSSLPPFTDWGEAPDISTLYGRTEEQAELTRWLVPDPGTLRARVITVLGMGGMGKTALTPHVVRQVATQFDGVIWRSLLNAPPFADIVLGWLRLLSDQPVAKLPESIDAQFSLLFDHLRRRRCLLILDNAESIMQDGERAGYTRLGYESYGQLFRRMGESQHQSCLLITSREQPQEVARLMRETPLVRTLPLTGLDRNAGQAILRTQGMVSSVAEADDLIQRYSGNPLALMLIAETIQELFDGDVATFLQEEAPIFDDIRDVLDQQVARLSSLERDLLLTLAIERQPMSETDLWQAFAHGTAKRSVLEALRSLQRRSLLETFRLENSSAAFGLQNVVTEYLTALLIAQVYQEVQTEKAILLHSHPLIKAHAPEYVRQTQQRVLLQPIGERLLGTLGQTELAARSQRLLGQARLEQPLQASFLAGNLLNLLLHVGIDVRSYDFSNLSVWQAYLRGADLPGVDFTHADLTGSVFTDYAGAVTSLTTTPDGQLLIVGADNGVIYLWRLSDRQLVGICEGHQGQVSALACSPDGTRLVSAGDDTTVRLWEIEQRRLLHVLYGHTGGVTSVGFHPSGTLIVSGGIDQSAHIWDAHTGQPLHILQEHGYIVSAVAFSPDGTLLATAGHDQTVRLWDWQHTQVRHRLTGHTGPVVTLAFSPHPIHWNSATDMTREEKTRVVLASGGFDQTVRLWDVQSGEALGCLTGHQAPILTTVFSPDGAWLMSGSDDQSIRVWDMHSGVESGARGQTARLLQGHYGAVTALAVSPQTSESQSLLVSGSNDKTVRLWNLATGNALASLRGHSKWIQALVFTPNQTLLVGGNDGQNVRVWDGRTGRTLHTLHGHSSLTEKLAFRHDGAQLASASWDKTGRIWDLPQGQTRHILQGHTDAVATVVIGPEAQEGNWRKCHLIASGGLDRIIRLWDGEQGKLLGCWHGHRDRVVAFAFSPASNGCPILLASGSWDHSVGVWDTQSGELRYFLQGHLAPVECVAFHPSGKWLASGSWDRTVRLWDVESSVPVGETVRTLACHSGGLEMVTFSPDGALLASCACDKTVCVWDVPSGQLRYQLEGHRSWVRCIAFSLDSTQLASGSDDGTVKLWDVTAQGAGTCLQTTAMQDPYTNMKITYATGLTPAQKTALVALGAVEK